MYRPMLLKRRKKIAELTKALMARDLKFFEQLFDNPNEMQLLHPDNTSTLLLLLESFDFKNESERAIFNLIADNPDTNLNHQWSATGETLLHICDTVPLLEQLLRRNVDLNMQDFNGNTPLMSHINRSSFYDRKLQFCERLIQSGADVNLTNKKGEVPIIKLTLKNDSMEVINFINYPQFNINAVDANGNTILDVAQQPDLIRELIKYPFEPLYLISALKISNDALRKEIYLKWNKLGEGFIEEIVNHLESYKNNAAIVQGVWKFLLQKRLPISGVIKKIFFRNIPRSIILQFDLLEKCEYKEFLYSYLQYGTINVCELQTIYANYDDNRMINRIMAKAYFETIPTLLFEFEPFLYILLNPRCNIQQTLENYVPALYRCIANIQNIARFCKLPKHLYEFYKDSDAKCDNVLKELEVINSKPPSLLELSRNETRLYLAEKYNIPPCFKELQKIMDSIGLPAGIREIINFERPLYCQIPKLNKLMQL